MPEADFPPTIAEGDRVGRVETPAARAPADRQPSVWKLLWPSSLLAIGALCAGSLSIIGYMEWIARAQFDAHAFVGWILFVAGGGAAVGVAIVSVGRILPRSAIPAATLVIVGLFVFSFFVWPTPFLYHSLESRHAGILRVNRVTGEVLYIPVSERRR